MRSPHLSLGPALVLDPKRKGDLVTLTERRLVLFGLCAAAAAVDSASASSRSRCWRICTSSRLIIVTGASNRYKSSLYHHRDTGDRLLLRRSQVPEKKFPPVLHTPSHLHWAVQCQTRQIVIKIIMDDDQWYITMSINDYYDFSCNLFGDNDLMRFIKTWFWTDIICKFIIFI